MSTTRDGCRIVCNGNDCKAEATAPVALHPRLSVGQETAQRVDGWLFVARGGEWRHYCPNCQAYYLNGLLDQIPETTPEY